MPDKVKWSKDGYGPGNVILACDNLIAVSDTGELAVVAADPKFMGDEDAFCDAYSMGEYAPDLAKWDNGL